MRGQIFNNAEDYRTMKRLVAYDLDGTLAQSKQSIDPETAALLVRLLKVAAVAVISGGDWPQFTQQLVRKLPEDTDLDRLFLLPASGTKLYRYRGRWEQVYRLIVAFRWDLEIAWIKFFGSHADYDKIDALTVSEY